MRGLPAMVCMAFGTVRECSPNRVPRPAARIMAFTMPRRPGTSLFNPVAEHGGVRVSGRYARCRSEYRGDVAHMGGFAVAELEPREDADGLELPLQPGQVERPRQCVPVEREAAPVLVVSLPAAPFAVAEVVIAVPQQAGQVVGGGAVQRILKVDDAPGLLPRHQQVSAVIVTVIRHCGWPRALSTSVSNAMAASPGSRSPSRAPRNHSTKMPSSSRNRDSR